MPPKKEQAGVLPISAAARAAPSAPPKVAAPRLKLQIRRLPPLLTLEEFDEILGDEWKPNNGKVDWREYRSGKMKAAGKHPSQSTCYLHLLNDSLIADLYARFRAVEWHDKAGTSKVPELKSFPPTLDYAPNQRTPLTAKARVDPRQGTIDQDPEYQAFLEHETEPIVKPAALDSVNATETEKPDKPKVTTTPLIESIREKKANKEKAKVAKEEKKDAKSHARAESKDKGTLEKDTKDTKDSKEAKNPAKQQHKVEQATKEVVKVLNKQANNKKAQQDQKATPQPQAIVKPVSSPAKHKKQTAPSPKQSPKQANAAPVQPASAASNAAAQSPAPQRPQRQRGNAEGIKRMLQKDLGIRPKPAASSQQTTTSSSSSQQLANSATKAPPTAPAAATSNPKQQAKSVPTSSSQSSPQASTPSVAPNKAYLKHANPSQGMTEILIQQALAQYGDVTSVTIDPRKGTAIAIFKDAEALQKAIETKRIPVAQGSVEVNPFRINPGGSGGRGGFKGSRRGGRGGAAASPAAAKASEG